MAFVDGANKQHLQKAQPKVERSGICMNARPDQAPLEDAEKGVKEVDWILEEEAEIAGIVS